MGVTLSEPITAKESTRYENSYFKVGASAMQGWRITMEDDHFVRLNVTRDERIQFFGVFDGHGGKLIAEYAAKTLPDKLLFQNEYREGDFPMALKKSFLTLDEDMKKESINRGEAMGSTAVCLLIRGLTMYCANIGDSRAIASVRGHVQLLSIDHKPTTRREQMRIVAAGGFVDIGRVNGDLAMSRAFGDYMYKTNRTLTQESQIITAFPDVLIKDITNEHEFIVIACDGIWDVLNSNDVITFVRAQMGKRIHPEQICEELMDMCLSRETNLTGIGCDNMTVIIIGLCAHFSYQSLCDKCLIPKNSSPPECCLPNSYPIELQDEVETLLSSLSPAEQWKLEQAK